MLKDKVQIGLVHKSLLQKDQEWQSRQLFQDSFLPHDWLLLVLSNKVLLINLFNCYNVLGGLMSGQINDTECAWA